MSLQLKEQKITRIAVVVFLAFQFFLQVSHAAPPLDLVTSVDVPEIDTLPNPRGGNQVGQSRKYTCKAWEMGDGTCEQKRNAACEEAKDRAISNLNQQRARRGEPACASPGAKCEGTTCFSGFGTRHDLFIDDYPVYQTSCTAHARSWCIMEN